MRSLGNRLTIRRLLAERRLVLGPGDRLFLYSDGLPRAMDPGGEPFGGRRLLDAVMGGAGGTLEASVARLRSEIETWCGEAGPGDDLSILGVEIGAPA